MNDTDSKPRSTIKNQKQSLAYNQVNTVLNSKSKAAQLLEAG
jgi:hypothetical protein